MTINELSYVQLFYDEPIIDKKYENKITGSRF